MTTYFKDVTGGAQTHETGSGSCVKMEEARESSSSSSSPPQDKIKWIQMISEKLIPRFFIAQQYVMKQGDEGTELYIIKQGKVAVEIDIGDGEVKTVGEPGPGGKQATEQAHARTSQCAPPYPAPMHSLTFLLSLSLSLSFFLSLFFFLSFLFLRLLW